MRKFIISFLILSGSLWSHICLAGTADKKIKIVEKQLHANISKEKKLKVVVAFQNWVDDQIEDDADKLSEEDLAQIMQFSNLLRIMNPRKFNFDKCQGTADKILTEDLTPIRKEPSSEANLILDWLKILCR